MAWLDWQETGVCSWKNKNEFKNHPPKPEVLERVKQLRSIERGLNTSQ